ncbi:DUF4129 domain-containing protein [Paenibacillus sp. sptzw28]|uniref:DUF4129 domain-containing protein n=1 Tax=Paenibacillus sp. sptzw28 TaxID=715179 RepID=UPI001C6F2FA3|nr:DUF4129 domain-containing protein [Paenibacillus sp. sptzw28]QYR19057.1 DUF4129 domain-containing protein [Paenibacillus sp. sptzw28]
MKQQLRDSLLALRRGFIELILFVPIAWVFQAFMLPPGTEWLWIALLPIGYPAGFMINRLFSFRHSFMILLISAVIAFCYSLLLFGATKEGALSLIAASLTLYRGGKMAVTPWHNRLLPRHYTAGLLVYFGVSVVCSLAEPFKPFKPLMIGLGLVALFLTLFAANRDNVNNESLSNDDKPMIEPTVRKHNLYLVSTVAVITLLIVFSYQLQAALGALWHTFSSILNKWLSSGGEKAAVPPPQTEPPAQPPGLPSGEGKSMPLWLDILLYGIAIAVLGAVLWLVLRQLRHLPEWLRQLREKLAQLFGREKGEQNQGYVDVVESIRKPGLLGGLRLSRTKEPRSRWKDLQDNESRIRYLYRQWLARRVKAGYAFKPHLTPIETGADAGTQASDSPSAETLIHQYNSVRYGKKKITDETIRRFLERAEK